MLSSPFSVSSSEKKEVKEEENHNRNTQKSTTGYGYVIIKSFIHGIFCSFGNKKDDMQFLQTTNWVFKF